MALGRLLGMPRGLYGLRQDKRPLGPLGQALAPLGFWGTAAAVPVACAEYSSRALGTVYDQYGALGPMYGNRGLACTVIGAWPALNGILAWPALNGILAWPALRVILAWPALLALPASIN